MSERLIRTVILVLGGAVIGYLAYTSRDADRFIVTTEEWPDGGTNSTHYWVTDEDGVGVGRLRMDVWFTNADRLNEPMVCVHTIDTNRIYIGLGGGGTKPYAITYRIVMRNGEAVWEKIATNYPEGAQ